MLKTVLITLYFTFSIIQYSSGERYWGWQCTQNTCQRVRVNDKNEKDVLSLPTCQLICGNDGSIWPKPTGNVNISKTLIAVNLNKVIINNSEDELIIAAVHRLKSNLIRLQPKNVIAKGGVEMKLQFVLKSNNANFSLNNNEGYLLHIVSLENSSIVVTIEADNFFGARNALETLFQLVVYDENNNTFIMPDYILITDAPVYPYRGILLDTARNYISVDTIKRTIEGMAASKLNVLHWHITDSQSFPYVSDSAPFLSHIGAFSPKKIYTPNDVEEIINFAKVRGVRIMPEFDAPSHVGEGWQDTGFLTCFNKKPWGDFCKEPPCGQLDPTKEGLYDLLELIYKDMVKQFNPDIFHMGGDEVSLECWKADENITNWMQSHEIPINSSGFLELWSRFQNESYSRLMKNTNRKIPVILWTSSLTSWAYLDKYLPKDDYIIQVWTHKYDWLIKYLLYKGYKIILSNYDALYLDCGFSGWINAGNNWCSPYKGWQKIYENSPLKIAGEKHQKLIVGSEAALWTEQVDDNSVDGRLWPRAAALAERVWAEPSTGWGAAEARMLVHRERLVNLGIFADSLEPEWCRQHPNECPA